MAESDDKELDIIEDFQYFPKAGEAPLNVVFYATVRSGHGAVIKRLWTLEGGDKEIDLNYEITTHQYQTPKVYPAEKLEIKLLSRGGRPGGTREFPIDVQDPSKVYNAIIQVRQDNRPGWEFVDVKTSFEIILRTDEPSERFEKVLWQFGDEDDPNEWEDTNRTFRNTHTYNTPGQYTGQARIKKNREEIYYTKSFNILILPK